MIGPCFECKERHIACHGICEKYKAWRTQYDAEKNAKAAILADEQAVMGVKMHGMKRIKKQIWER